MRVLALDYGSARCGCAVSDPTGTLATPIDHIERRNQLFGSPRDEFAPAAHQHKELTFVRSRYR